MNVTSFSFLAAAINKGMVPLTAQLLIIMEGQGCKDIVRKLQPAIKAITREIELTGRAAFLAYHFEAIAAEHRPVLVGALNTYAERERRLMNVLCTGGLRHLLEYYEDLPEMVSLEPRFRPRTWPASVAAALNGSKAVCFETCYSKWRHYMYNAAN